MQLFLQEERERELEELYEANIVGDERQNAKIGGDNPAAGTDGDDLAAVTKATKETLMAGERLIEALEVADADRQLMAGFEANKSEVEARDGEAAAARMNPPGRNPVFMAAAMASGGETVSAEKYVLSVVEKIPASSLSDALLVLSFGQVCSMLEYLNHWARQVRWLFGLDCGSYADGGPCSNGTSPWFPGYCSSF